MWVENNESFIVAQTILKFVSDKKLWKKHTPSRLNAAIDGLPIGVSVMKDVLKHHIKNVKKGNFHKQTIGFIIDMKWRNEVLLQNLKFIATDQLNLWNIKDRIVRFFFTPPRDEFELQFYKMICKAKDLKNIVSWINEANQSGFANEKTEIWLNTQMVTLR